MPGNWDIWHPWLLVKFILFVFPANSIVKSTSCVGSEHGWQWNCDTRHEKYGLFVLSFPVKSGLVDSWTGLLVVGWAMLEPWTSSSQKYFIPFCLLGLPFSLLRWPLGQRQHQWKLSLVFSFYMFLQCMHVILSSGSVWWCGTWKMSPSNKPAHRNSLWRVP